MKKQTLAENETGAANTVDAVPSEALRALDSEISSAGGPLVESEEFKGSVGRTLFDTPASADGTITVLLPANRVEGVTHQSLVRMKSKDGRSYLGAVVSGPFAEPFAL